MSEYTILVKVFHKKYSVCYTMELWNQGESAQMQILYNKGNEFSRWEKRNGKQSFGIFRLI